MMGNHLPQEVLFHTYATDMRHGGEHRIQNLRIPLPVAAHFPMAVTNRAAGTQNGLHFRNTLGLLGG